MRIDTWRIIFSIRFANDFRKFERGSSLENLSISGTETDRTDRPVFPHFPVLHNSSTRNIEYNQRRIGSLSKIERSEKKSLAAGSSFRFHRELIKLWEVEAGFSSIGWSVRFLFLYSCFFFSFLQSGKALSDMSSNRSCDCVASKAFYKNIIPFSSFRAPLSMIFLLFHLYLILFNIIVTESAWLFRWFFFIFIFFYFFFVSLFFPGDIGCCIRKIRFENRKKH